MEQIINYRNIPENKKSDVLSALLKTSFVPAYGKIKTLKRIMDKSVSETDPQYYFVLRDDNVIGYLFLIGDESKYRSLPWLSIDNADELQIHLSEQLLKLQIDFFKRAGNENLAQHTQKRLEEYQKGIGKRPEDMCR